MEDDTIKLLRECSAGLKMGIESIDNVLDDVENGALRGLLKDSYDIHCRLKKETESYLEKYHDEGKEPAPIAKAMAKMKCSFKTMGENPD